MTVSIAFGIKPPARRFGEKTWPPADWSGTKAVDVQCYRAKFGLDIIDRTGNVGRFIVVKLF